MGKIWMTGSERDARELTKLSKITLRALSAIHEGLEDADEPSSVLGRVERATERLDETLDAVATRRAQRHLRARGAPGGPKRTNPGMRRVMRLAGLLGEVQSTLYEVQRLIVNGEPDQASDLVCQSYESLKWEFRTTIEKRSRRVERQETPTPPANRPVPSTPTSIKEAA